MIVSKIYSKFVNLLYVKHICAKSPPGGPQSAPLVGKMTRCQAVDAVVLNRLLKRGRRLGAGCPTGAGTDESCPALWHPWLMESWLCRSILVACWWGLSLVPQPRFLMFSNSPIVEVEPLYESAVSRTGRGMWCLVFGAVLGGPHPFF